MATTTEVDSNNVLTVKRRTVAAKAVQFTGKNAREVIAFVKAELGDTKNLLTRNGGTYIKIHFDGNTGVKALKGDYVVIDVDGQPRVYTPVDFDKFFLIKK